MLLVAWFAELDALEVPLAAVDRRDRGVSCLGVLLTCF